MLGQLNRSLWSWLSRLLMLSLMWGLLMGAHAQPGASIYTIPVVFHVLHENGNENISDAQVFDAIDILNEHYDAPTVALTPPFDTVAADMDIAFVLASTAPDGTPTSGIDRIETPLTENAGAPESYLNPWPRNRYLNIWVVRSLAMAGGLAYISNLPEQADVGTCTDGVMIYHSYVGSIGTASIVSRRTLTQAVGRYLNLKWLHEDPIDGGPCGDDEVSDTPICPLISFCNSENALCSPLPANIENFMMFSYCQKMFTLGQRARVHACLNSTVAQRNELVSGNYTTSPDCFTSVQTVAVGTNDIRIAPVPFGTHISVSGLPPGSHQLELRDASGRTMYDGQLLGDGVIELGDHLPAGPYTLLVQNDHFRSARMIMKQ